MNDYKTLTVLGLVSPYIEMKSRRTFAKGLAMDKEDLIQEGRLKVVQVVERYHNKPISDLVGLAIGSLSNLYNKVIRTSKLSRLDGITIDLSEVFSISDSDRLQEMYLNIQVRELYDMFDGDEKLVFSCLVDPPDDLVQLAIDKYVNTSRAEVKITKTTLSEYLGMSKLRLRSIIESIRIKAEPLFNF